MKSLQQWLQLARRSKGVSLPEELKQLVNKPKESLGDSEKKKLRRYFLTRIHPEGSSLFAEPQANVDATNKALEEFNNNFQKWDRAWVGCMQARGYTVT